MPSSPVIDHARERKYHQGKQLIVLFCPLLNPHRAEDISHMCTLTVFFELQLLVHVRGLGGVLK